MALKPYPILRLTIPLATGIFLSDTWLRSFDWLIEQGILLTILFLLLLGLVSRVQYTHRWLFGGALYLFLFVLGSWLTQLQWEAVSFDWEQEKIAYKGIIQETPLQKKRSVACKVRTKDRDIILYISNDTAAQHLQVGDELLFYTRIKSPQNAGNPNEFDYASYLLRQRISGTAFVYAGYWQKTNRHEALTFKQQALNCRERILNCYRQLGFGEREFAVLSALTVGYKEELSDELRESYSIAGVSHVLALSGLHVGVFWILLSFLLRPLDRRLELRILKWVIITFILWLFAFLVGLAPSVVRAVVMCMLMGLAGITRNRGIALNTWAIAAFFMLLYCPFYLFDVSFQLSFIAVLSILLFYSRIYGLWQVKQPVIRYVWGIVAVSLAAQLGTAPLIMYYFSNFSVYFLLANIMVAPLIPFIIYLAICVLVVSPLPFLSVYLAHLLEKSIQLLNESTLWVAHLPAASIHSLYFSKVEIWIIYGLLFLGFLFIVTKRRRLLISFFSLFAFFLILLWGVRLPEQNAPCLVFYHLPNHPAVHFIEADKSSYLYLNKEDSLASGMRYLAQTFWQREKLDTPHRLGLDYEDRRIWSHNGIIHWKGINICMLTDGFWRNKTAPRLLDIDYLYLCKGYKGKIASLQKLFHIKKVIFDASLSDYKIEKFKEECKTLHLSYIDISEQGSLRILL